MSDLYAPQGFQKVGTVGMVPKPFAEGDQPERVRYGSPGLEPAVSYVDARPVCLGRSKDGAACHSDRLIPGTNYCALHKHGGHYVKPGSAKDKELLAAKES